MGRALPAVALGSKIGRSLGYFIGPSRRCRRCRILWRVFRRSRVAWRDRPCGRRRRRLSSRPALPHSPGCTRLDLETDDAAPPIYRRVTVFRVTAIARAIPNCRFGGVFAGHGGSGYLASIEMYARLKALLERMTRPERAARSLVCYPLGVSLRSPQRGG